MSLETTCMHACVCLCVHVWVRVQNKYLDILAIIIKLLYLLYFKYLIYWQNQIYLRYIICLQDMKSLQYIKHLVIFDMFLNVCIYYIYIYIYSYTFSYICMNLHIFVFICIYLNVYWVEFCILGANCDWVSGWHSEYWRCLRIRFLSWLITKTALLFISIS